MIFIVSDVLSTNMFKPEYLTGYILAFLGAIIWATYSTKTKVIKINSDELGSLFLFFSIIMLVLHFFLEDSINISNINLISVFFLALTGTSYIFWDKSMKEENVKSLTSLCYFIPLISSLLLFLFADNNLNSNISIAALFIISGSLIANIHHIINK